MTEFPTEGGSYIRDPETGALVRQPEGTPPEPAPAPAPEATPTEPKRKGGK